MVEHTYTADQVGSHLGARPEMHRTVQVQSQIPVETWTLHVQDLGFNTEPAGQIEPGTTADHKVRDESVVRESRVPELGTYFSTISLALGASWGMTPVGGNQTEEVPSALTRPSAEAISGVLFSGFIPSRDGFDFGFLGPMIYPQ